MINLNEFSLETSALEPGDTIRVNHSSCDAGADTRRRLYITRPNSDPAKLIAYCHNCQQSGVESGTQYQSYRNEKHNFKGYVSTTVTDKVEPPKGLIFDSSLWTVPAYSWAAKNALTQQMISRYHIGLDPTTNRVYLPRYAVMYPERDGVENLEGYQLRKVEDNNGPKYLTVSKEDSPGYTEILALEAGDYKKATAVLVEDLVSGMHIAEASIDAELDTVIIVNYGVKVNLEALDFLTRCRNSIIWLDNDNPHVIKQAEVMARTLGMLTSQRIDVVSPDYSDPKHYCWTQIKEVLNGFN